ncbi:outer membrane lipoprotein chaperone LolA [Kistimonas scapharcae]|uniref:Outer-membrane lipoprotein carrier protein n=1 Tax=Kistimonas scapharcae TaxID=1036133 RepID=A0ABP8UV87_9GAMM
MFQSDKFSIRRLGGLALSITLLTSPAYGESAPSNKMNTVEVSAQEQQAASQLAKLLNPLHYIQAGFAQHTLEASGKRIQESEGVMTVQRPNLFRWEVKKPFPQVVVSNGQKVWLYDMDLEQVTIQKLDARTNTTPALILSGETADLTRNFRVTESVADGVALFTLIPKGQDALFENLQLSFQGKTLREMMLTDALGARTRIEFSNLSSSSKRKLAEKDFELYIPPGVDVIDDES